MGRPAPCWDSVVGVRRDCWKLSYNHEYQHLWNTFNEPIGKEVVSGVRWLRHRPFIISRWSIIEATEPEQPLSKLLPFVLGKALSAQIGSLKSVKRLYKGDILVETRKNVTCVKWRSQLQQPLTASSRECPKWKLDIPSPSFFKLTWKFHKADWAAFFHLSNFSW